MRAANVQLTFWAHQELLPGVRRRLAVHLAGQRARLLLAFDQVLHEFETHRHNIFVKLVSILEARAVAYCEQVLTEHATQLASDIENDVDGAADGHDEPSRAVEQLLSDTRAFRRTIAKVFDAASLEHTMALTWPVMARALRSGCVQVASVAASRVASFRADMQLYALAVAELVEAADVPASFVNLLAFIDSLK